MKKLTIFLLSLALTFCFAACGGSPAPSAQTNVSFEVKEPGKTLIVYFSMPETSSSNNMTKEEENSTVVIDGKVLGNTQYVAHVIQENTGADIFRIEQETDYTTDHKALVDLAKKERNDNGRPALKANIENLGQYDTIFIGYPIWWSDFPMILYTFFDQHDFSGKTIVPFSTHGGSQLAGTVRTITELEPNATVVQNAFTVSRDDVQEAKPDIVAWLKTLGFMNKK